MQQQRHCKRFPATSGLGEPVLGAIVFLPVGGYAAGIEFERQAPSMSSASPFDDFRNLFAHLPEGDVTQAGKVWALFAKADKPQGSLGRIEDIAAWLARWTGRAPPSVLKPLVAIFAGNHGVAVHGISPRGVESTAARVELCAAGGAAINQVCVANDLGLKVFDLALHLPTADITVEPALDERGCAATMAFGMEAIAGGADLFCIGDLGVGNTTVAAALCAALFGGKGADWVGPGSGADAVMQARKAACVDQALALHGDHLKDPFEALRRVGGREFAAIVGAILAARMEKIPVLLDGYSTSAAAAVLYKLDPTALDHCMFSHVSTEPGHARLLAKLGVRPLLGLGIDHGEAVGAGIAAGLVKTAALISSGMAAAVK